VVVQHFVNTENGNVIAKSVMVLDYANLHFVKYNQVIRVAKNMKDIA